MQTSNSYKVVLEKPTVLLNNQEADRENPLTETLVTINSKKKCIKIK
jgi:hypothetical protein